MKYEHLLLAEVMKRCFPAGHDVFVIELAAIILCSFLTPNLSHDRRRDLDCSERTEYNSAGICLVILSSKR